jgi:hypothetical protein
LHPPLSSPNAACEVHSCVLVLTSKALDNEPNRNEGPAE